MKKGAIIGVGLAAAGLIYFALRAKGSAPPNGNGGSFEFGQPAAYIAGSVGGWQLLGFDCPVSNNSEAAIQRTLEVWFTQTVDYSTVPGFEHYGVVTTDPKPIYLPGHSALDVSLQPGESSDYHYTGLDYLDEGVFLMGTGEGLITWNFWLQDDLGNKSSVATIQT